MAEGRRGTPIAGLAAAALVSLGIGALTAFAQGWLPGSIASLANSAGPWCLVAFLLASRMSSAGVAALTPSLTRRRVVARPMPFCSRR